MINWLRWMIALLLYGWLIDVVPRDEPGKRMVAFLYAWGWDELARGSLKAGRKWQ